MDIFNDDNKLTNNYWKYTEIGDSLQGTLINVRMGINQMSGLEQKLYDIKTKDGEVWIVSGKVGIDMQMERVKIGQIVGFKFTGTKPAKQKGFQDAKLVQVYANPSLVDEEFLKSYKALKEAEALYSGATNQNADAEDDGRTVDDIAAEMGAEVEDDDDTTFVTNHLEHPFMTDTEKVRMSEIITKLAEEKLGVTGDAGTVRDKVMEATDLAFTEMNLAKIAKKLSELPDRK